MPNWCDNSIDITGPFDKISGLWNKIQEKKKTDENYGLLEAMVPIGEWDYGSAVNAWGTKWEVSTDDLELIDNEDGTAQISGFFQSAWGPPITAYETFVEENEDCDIDATYFEPGMDFAGIFRDGEDIWYDGISEEIKEPRENWTDWFIELDEQYGFADWYEDEEYEEEME